MSRGVVEDTRLEAEAKDTKKFRGQGQGQNLSRPRPRTKDTGASVLQKKGSLKNFFGGLKKKVFKKFFSGDLHLRKTKKDIARFLAFSNKISAFKK